MSVCERCFATEINGTHCLLGDRDLDRERVLERERLPLRLFRPSLLSFLSLREKNSTGYF